MSLDELFIGRPPGLDRDEILRRVELLAARPPELDDYRATREFYSPSVVCEFVGDKSRIPFAGRHVGVEALLFIQKAAHVEFEQTGHKITGVVIDGGRVAVRRSVDFRHRGTGQRGRVDLADFARFEDGLVVHLTEFRDTITILTMQGQPSWPGFEAPRR